MLSNVIMLMKDGESVIIEVKWLCFEVDLIIVVIVVVKLGFGC